MLRPEKDLEDPFAHLMCLGLDVFAKTQEVEATYEVAKTFPERISSIVKLFSTLGDMLARNVLKVQALLAKCGEHRTTEESTEEDLGKLDAQSVACQVLLLLPWVKTLVATWQSAHTII